MFDKPEIDAYRQIKAPSGLREKVMSMADTSVTRTPVRRIPAQIISFAAAAACLLLVLTGVLLIPTGPDVTVSFDGQVITGQPIDVTLSSEPAMASAARMLPLTSVTLSVTADEPADITVSGGYMVIRTSDGTILTSGTDCTAEGELTLEWTVLLADGIKETVTIGDTVLCLEMTEDGRCQIYRLEVR